MAADPRRALGRRGEELAAEHLQRLGFRLLARNHRTRHGELDLVARDGTALVFVEIKTCRAGGGRPSPWESLHERKRRQVRRMAREYLQARPGHGAAVIRFDAVGVLLDGAGRLVRLDHLQDAF